MREFLLKIQMRIHLGKYRVPFDDKVKLSERVRKLQNQSLTEFVELVKKFCSKSIKEIHPKKLQIRVNDFDKDTFQKLTEFLDNHKTQTQDEVQEPPRKILKVE